MEGTANAGFISERQTAWVSVEKQVGVVVSSAWAGCLLLIYYFFVSVEALKCRLGSNDTQEPLDSSTGDGGGVECSQASPTPSPVCCLGRAPRLQHYLINLGLYCYIVSDSKEQSGLCQPFRETCESDGWKPENYVLPLASSS